MIKLFLVEDEIVMRDGIRRHIDWEKEGIEFVGEAGDGELAYPMILEQKPDILVTDIKMPFMDGLELSELAKKALPELKIIILSGYDEFSYAQKALSLGVTEYLLKPITPAKLLETINKVKEDLEASRRLLKGVNRIASGEDGAKGKAISEKLDIEKVATNENVRESLEEFLRTGTQGETEAFLQEVFESVGEENVRSIIFLKYLTLDMYFSIVRFVNGLGGDISAMQEEPVEDVVAGLSKVETARGYIGGCLLEALRLRDKSSRKKSDGALYSALKYIDENFDKEEISLNAVAAAANMSPNHFSTVFSQEKGITFIEYLTRKRMERAKELLMTTGLRSSEIAYKVGYKDPHYFSYTFKKTQGMTAKEYRARGHEA